MTLDPRLVKIHEALEEYTKSGLLDKAAAPTLAPANLDDNTGPEVGGNHFMSRSDLMDLRSRLMQKSAPQLMAMFADQAMRKDLGIPVDQWVAGQPNQQAYLDALQRKGGDGQIVLKAMDSAGAGPLIRQDLEPILYALFVKNFPAWDRINKVPANGLLHAWNKITSFGDAQFMPELGTVTDDQNTYERANTNVAVLARRVGVSFKAGFAVQQGGAGYNLESEELTGGLRAMAHKLQKTIFQGQSTDSGGDADNELGAYDANGFTGLRALLNTSAAVNANLTGATPDKITEKINDSVVPIVDNGGAPSVVFIRANEHNIWNKQQLEIVRIMDRIDFVPGIRVPAIATSAGDLPLVPVPGDSIGFYDRSAKDTADIYVVDETSLSLPYLGSDSIQVLDIPVGVGGQLVHYYIVWIMVGLALKTNLWSNKVRAQIEA